MSVRIPQGISFSLKVEDGATPRGPEAMVADSDLMTWRCTGKRFSLCEKDEQGTDRRPVVRPDGVRNGCMTAPAASGANDSIDVCRGAVWLGGSVVSVPGAVDVALPRPAAGMKKTVSVALSGGRAVTAIAGADGADFSAVRGAAGGPPWVPSGYIELALVRFSSDAAAPVDAKEIVFSPEYSHAPEYALLPYSAAVRFVAPLAAIHAGGTPRAVWISWHEPRLSPLDAMAYRAPVERSEIDAVTLRPSAKRIQPGAARWPLSGDAGDLAHRIEKNVRLYEFRPNAAGTRVELAYAIAETTADYHPRERAEGDALLTAAAYPASETA